MDFQTNIDPMVWLKVGFVLLVAALALYAMWRIAVVEYRTATTRTVAYAVVLAAMAAALGQFSIPVEAAKVAPAQHMVNIMAAVLLGPWWATLVAFSAAVFRNATGAGTPFAFPGGMIGALLAGLAWRATRKLRFAAAGEIVGTGIIGAAISVLVVAPAIMGSPMSAAFAFGSFMLSTVVGTAVGLVALVSLRKADVVDFEAYEQPQVDAGD